MHIEAGLNTFTIALQVAGGDKMGIQCLGVYLGNSVPAEVANMRQLNMVMRPLGLAQGLRPRSLLFSLDKWFI
jgi:hypothetical protein